MKITLSDENLQQMHTSAVLATSGPWMSSGGKANARVQARVPLQGGGNALYILCALTRSGWRSGSQVANDAYFIAQASPERVQALIEEVQESRRQQRGESEDRNMLRRLAIILSGSDAPGEIKALTVTAQSFVDRCKQLARERTPITVDLLSAMDEVLRMSDRDHEAWSRAKSAISECRAAMFAAAPQLEADVRHKVSIYEKIYGPLRKCPGAGSIYSATPSGGELPPHGMCAHAGVVAFYCEFGHVHIGEPALSQGCHTHSLSGVTNDTKR